MLSFPISTASTTFDWEHVEKAYFTLGKFGGSTVSSWSLELDGIIFIGGMKIKPFEEYSETLNPPAKDQTSINQYDIHPYPQNDTQISSFEQAQAEGARILANLKNPIPRLTLTKLAPTTQYHPSNVVTISGVDYRITKMTYEWASKKKECHVTYKVIGKTNPLPPIWTEQNELRYLVK